LYLSIEDPNLFNLRVIIYKEYLKPKLGTYFSLLNLINLLARY
jgi:hypothetical protein